jgi:hypothetical protein
MNALIVSFMFFSTHFYGFSVQLKANYPDNNVIPCEVFTYYNAIYCEVNTNKLYLEIITVSCYDEKGDDFDVFTNSRRISQSEALNIINNTPKPYLGSIITIPDRLLVE